jgi:ribonuclease Z
MEKIVVLGTANAIPGDEHENTHLMVEGGDRTVLIDCSSSPVPHLRKAGLDFDRLTDLILTHFHPDHVSGAPLLLMDLWLMGRQKPLEIYGLEHTINRFEKMMSLYDWQVWPNFYPVHFHQLAEREMSPVLLGSGLRIFSSPVKHLIPTIGLRVEFLDSEKVLAYSCDSEPCSQVVRLGEKADLLFHEATGKGIGHSSAYEAGEIANQSKAKSLYLIHYSTRADTQALVEEARSVYTGPVNIAQDFMTIRL